MAKKTLLLVRHAKSCWKDFSITDHERPLNGRGKRDAPSMGERLLSRKIIPDTVFSSTAIRAKITAKIICQKIGYPEEKICFLDKLYHAEAKDLLSHILQLQDRFESAMLVGHNPGMTDLAANKWNIPISNLPTCGILEISFATRSRNEVSVKTIHSTCFDFPKNSSLKPKFFKG